MPSEIPSQPPGTADPTAEYSINFPGLQDVIKVPPLEDKALRVERIQRMTTNPGILPQSLRWVQAAVTWLDDIQDMLITALTVGKIVAPKLLARFAGPVGFALTVNDLLNLGTLSLSVPLSGGGVKLNHYKDALQLIGSRAARLERTTTFLSSPVRWIGFLLQAGQVLRDRTGYGLQLGGVMSLFSDIFWAPYRLLSGEQVTTHGPPDADILMKAYRVMMRGNFLTFLWDKLSTDDLKMVVMGLRTAVNVIADGAPGVVAESMLENYGSVPIPVFGAWNSATIAALKLTGNDGFIISNPIPSSNIHASLADTVRLGVAHNFLVIGGLAQKLREGPDGMFCKAALEETGDVCWQKVVAPDAHTDLLTPYERFMGEALKNNIAPPFQAIQRDVLVQCRDDWKLIKWQDNTWITATRITPSAPPGPQPDCPRTLPDGTLLFFCR